MDKLTLKRSFCNISNVANGELTLVEDGTQATLRKVTIHSLPPDAYAVKLDPIRIHKLFQPREIKAFNKHGDYLIVTENALVIVEMKSRTEVSTDLVTDCQEKFRSDYCILEYCDSVFKRILSKNPFFSGKTIYFALLYQQGPIAKTATSAKPAAVGAPTHTTPENFMRLAVRNEERLSFARLLH